MDGSAVSLYQMLRSRLQHDSYVASKSGRGKGEEADAAEGLAYEMVAVTRVTSREEAINWIIENQFGRRNLTPEQKSYLRGKRYQVEKTAGHGESAPQNEGQTTAERLAAEYQVSPATIERDAEFAEAVDTLEEAVRQDIRQSVLRRKSREDQTRVTKKRVVQAAKAVKEWRVEPLPFMKRAERMVSRTPQESGAR